jgi:hypothetical protein
MRVRLRVFEPGEKFTDAVKLAVLEKAVPFQLIQSVVRTCGVAEQRIRKLPAAVCVLLVIAMNLFIIEDLPHVLRRMVQGVRLVFGDGEYPLAGKSAISQARDRLGDQPLETLFRAACKPIATTATRGAFLFGLRMMAIDGTNEDVPDTPANAEAFGRHHSDRGAGAFPQVKGVYLIECATHVICDAIFGACHMSERAAAKRLLRSVGKGMLVTWDRGFFGYELLRAALATGAHVLGRVPANVILTPVCCLADGSFLAYVYPSPQARRQRRDGILVRVIEYTFDDPQLPGYGETHRLITSLLDAELYPALALIVGYHERWEIEITLDELDTHQHLPGRPLRSHKPVGVRQELYGWLLAHFAIRVLMHEAALSMDADPDRLSFTNALRIIQQVIPEFQLVDPSQHSELYQRMLHDITQHRLPERDHRINPRVVKRKMSKFYLKRPQHCHPAQPTKPFVESVVILK